MKFNTDRFGELEVPDESLIRLLDCILGFPNQTRYVLLDHDAEGAPFKWLQAVDNPALAFVVMDPCELLPEYLANVQGEITEQFESAKADNLIPMVICHIPHDDPINMTANLRAPVVVDAATRQGKQIVLKDEALAFDYRVFQSADQAPSTE